MSIEEMTIVDWQFLLFVCVPIGIGVLFTIWFLVQDLIDLVRYYRQGTFTSDFDEDGV